VGVVEAGLVEERDGIVGRDKMEANVLALLGQSVRRACLYRGDAGEVEVDILVCDARGGKPSADETKILRHQTGFLDRLSSGGLRDVLALLNQTGDAFDQPRLRTTGQVRADPQLFDQDHAVADGIVGKDDDHLSGMEDFAADLVAPSPVEAAMPEAMTSKSPESAMQSFGRSCGHDLVVQGALLAGPALRIIAPAHPFSRSWSRAGEMTMDDALHVNDIRSAQDLEDAMAEYQRLAQAATGTPEAARRTALDAAIQTFYAKCADDLRPARPDEQDV
jgi:hypothetical protein